MGVYATWDEDRALDEVAFTELLYRLAGQAARTRTFPPPEGYARWTPEAVRVLAHEVAGKGKKGDRPFALKVLEQATSQPSLERLILKSLRNVLVDQAKATETGKLRRRLRNVLPDDPQTRFVAFDEPFEAWALTDAPDDLWQGERDDLVQAALAVRGVTIDRWNEGGQTPRVVKVALWETSAGVLTAARARLEAQVLATVLRLRFVLISALDETSLSDVHAEAVAKPDAAGSAEDEALLNVTVDQIWASLSPLEQQVLCRSAEPVETWAAEFGLRLNAAQLVADRAKEKVRLAAAGDDDAARVVLELRGRSIGTGEAESRRLSHADADPEGGKR